VQSRTKITDRLWKKAAAYGDPYHSLPQRHPVRGSRHEMLLRGHGNSC